ncbi:AMP-binding protein [Kibdelosporangium phytohabitans]|uniref:AMP-dependent synthetase n=1 Tax=Kibdelosporangium phytohabitans TaxID=860235 RepID=A0A0N9HR17_9PSEU|nr:AMP-binding protein [Kibdelosporangium phytohabitans]ALG09617.1 AMP-dependent synthetase [Kibdelosporangium phytohabitans]MBE1469044.1 acetyl-CoA synthetase [Kibdelosporangium phytohabitans]
MTSAAQRVADLLAVHGDRQASTADLLCLRHPSDAVAFTVIQPDLTGQDLTFGELGDRSGRLASAFAALGVGRGDRVATLMGKSADLVVTLLAIWRLGAVHVPLFTAFAPPAIATRIAGNDTKIVVADPGQRHKLDAVRAEPTWRVITTGEPPTAADPAAPVAAGGDGTIIELFTSGTTGAPKGVPIPLRAIASMRMYQEYGLDHRPADVFWNAADPGWAYGLYYAIIGPLALGRRSLLLHAGFSPELTYQVLSTFGVTNFTAGPTAYRALRNAEGPVPADLALRRCSSAGEPLNPDVVTWAERTLGTPVRDHYGQTELGMTVANAWHADLVSDIKPGCMGRALPGWRMEVLRSDADEVAPAGESGRLAVDLTASPLMWFTGYRDAPERTAERFSTDGRWYLTGDTASMDDDGYVFFASRDDDVILMAGYRIGPFEVESVLLQHDGVAEAAVVGEPDALRGEVVVAHVVLQPGVSPTDDLAAELQRLVKQRFAAHAYPRRIHFRPELPRTPSGKIQRFLLRGARPATAGQP